MILDVADGHLATGLADFPAHPCDFDSHLRFVLAVGDRPMFGEELDRHMRYIDRTPQDSSVISGSPHMTSALANNVGEGQL